MNWHLNWNYMIIGAVIAVGGVACAIFRQRKSAITFEDYCTYCKERADDEVDLSSADVIKTILVLAKVDNEKIAPFLYRSYSDGKIKKKRVEYKTYPFELCPVKVQDAILMGEYILNRY